MDESDGEGGAPDWSAIRQAYEETREPVESIALRHDIQRSVLRKVPRQRGWRLRSSKFVEARNAGLVARLFELLERQIAQLENTTGDFDDTHIQRLGHLARTLEKLRALQKGEGAGKPDDSTEDLAAARQRLEKRIEEIAGQKED